MRNFRANLLAVLACLLLAIGIEAGLPPPRTLQVLPPGASLLSLPYQFGPFAGREAHGSAVKGFPGEVHRLYQEQGQTVELLAYPAEVSQHAPDFCLPYLGRSIIDRQRRPLQSNPAVELQTVISVSANPSAAPLACGYYWRRNYAGNTGLLASWLQQQWAAVTGSVQDAELVTICTRVDDIRHPQAALQLVYAFANDLEPYFQPRPPRLLESKARRIPGR